MCGKESVENILRCNILCLRLVGVPVDDLYLLIMLGCAHVQKAHGDRAGGQYKKMHARGHHCQAIRSILNEACFRRTRYAYDP